MDAAAALLAQEDATAVGPVIELVAPPPKRAYWFERFVTAEVFVAIPALFLDAFFLVVRNRDQILLAAGAADVAVPILQDRQVVDRKRHV